ncbi:MAG: sensor histidine kinase [Pelagimonas sp.]|nr:sensor histidine kinase [Pelagimonas sp.]
MEFERKGPKGATVWIWLAAIAGAILLAFALTDQSPPVGRDLQILDWQELPPPDRYSDRFAVTRYQAQIPEGWIHPGSALLIGHSSDAEQLFLNGQLIGSTGDIYTSARGYRGVAAAQIARFYPLPMQVVSEGPYQLEIVTFSAFYNVSPLDGLLMLGDAEALRDHANRLNAPIRLRDAGIIALLLVCAGFGAASASGQGYDSRNRWMAPFFLSLLCAVFPSTLTAYELGLNSPLFVQLTEASPVVPFGLLYLSAITAGRVSALQWGAVGGMYLTMAASYGLDVPLPVFVALGDIQAGLVIAAFVPSLWQILRAQRQGQRISRYAYAFVLSVVLGALAFAAFGPLLPPLWDPGGLMIIALSISALLVTADHMAWDRQALHQVTGQLLVAQDQERERLAKDLHDEVSHRLTASRLRLEAALRRADGLLPQDIRQTSEELRGLGLDISALVEGLRPASLEAMGFGDAVRHAVARWNRIGGLKLRIQMPADLAVSEAVQIHVVRILQEALLNAVRHAQATQVDITLERRGATGRLTVADDGCGFRPQDTPRGMGLSAMRERAGLIDGRFHLVAQPGRGCRIELEFPLL